VLCLTPSRCSPPQESKISTFFDGTTSLHQQQFIHESIFDNELDKFRNQTTWEKVRAK